MVKRDPNVDYGGKAVGQPFEGQVSKNITFLTTINETMNVLYPVMKQVLYFCQVIVHELILRKMY